MSEGNGNETRLDRIERVLERIALDHEEFRHEHKQLLTAQVLQKDQIERHTEQIDKLLKGLENEGRERREKDAALDARLADLVKAIGDLIRHIPPENLR